MRLAGAGAAAIGALGYVVLAAVAAIRVSRFGLRGVPWAPWWIAMSCAGFATLAFWLVTVVWNTGVRVRRRRTAVG